MAQIDLRHATIEVKDGFAATGAVNQTMTAPANGNTTITVDGFTKALPVGAEMTIAGSTDTYTIVSTVGGSTPTSITFTPALRTAAGIPVDNAVVTVGPNKLTVKIGEGNLTYDEKRNMEYVRDRRAISFVRTGDEDPMDVSMDFIWEFLSSDSGDPPTIEEALKQTGNASTWVTSGSDPCEPYCVDLVITYTPPCSGVKAERITLKEYRWESGSHDVKQGTVASKGKCKIAQAVLARV